MTEDRLTIPLTDQEQAATLRLTEAGRDLFGGTQSLVMQTGAVKEMPRAAFLFLSMLLGTGTASAYDIYKGVRERSSRAGRDRLHLPVQAAYRAAAWLKNLRYIEVADVVDEVENGNNKTLYRVTDLGAKALKEAGLHQVQLALAWIPQAQH